MGGDVHKELNDALKAAAEPVARDAEHLALTQIRNMPRSPHWAGMRIGVSVARGVVYMVPAARSKKRIKRPNLSDLLLNRAMDPALERNAAKIEHEVDRMLGRLAGENGFV
jgi:hypothetical protein